MKTDLFPEAVGDSPRLRWIKSHGVKTTQTPAHEVGTEDEFGNESLAWYATVNGKTMCGGDSEDDAIAALARYLNIKLWNET